MKYYLTGENLKKACELSHRETRARLHRDYYKEELSVYLSSCELWEHLKAATGHDFCAGKWRFSTRDGSVSLIADETKPLYTPEQIAGWKWRPL